jgi:hypothetical protein
MPEFTSSIACSYSKFSTLSPHSKSSVKLEFAENMFDLDIPLRLDA